MVDKPAEPARRVYYRVRYPAKARPVLKTLDGPSPVTELSEGGCRVEAPWGLGDEVRGCIRFADGRSEFVEGAVIRKAETEVVIQFTRGIDFRRMIIEQRFLLTSYPEIRRCWLVG